MPVPMVIHTNATIQAVNAAVQASSHHGSAVPTLIGLAVGFAIIASYFMFVFINNQIKKRKAVREHELRIAEQEAFLSHLRNKRRQKHCKQQENMKRILSK